MIFFLEYDTKSEMMIDLFFVISVEHGLCVTFMI